MPEHYAVDCNVVSGSVHFESVKVMQVNYADSEGNPISFTKAPRVQLTMLNNSANVPFKTVDTKSGSNFTGFKIGFQNAVTLDVEWQVMTRN